MPHVFTGIGDTMGTANEPVLWCFHGDTKISDAHQNQHARRGYQHPFSHHRGSLQPTVYVYT